MTAPVHPPIQRDAHARALAKAVADERARCAKIAREGAPDAFGKLDWPYLREKIAKAIEAGA